MENQTISKYILNSFAVSKYSGEHIIDEGVTIVEPPLPQSKKVLVYSPKLSSTVLVPRADLVPAL